MNDNDQHYAYLPYNFIPFSNKVKTVHPYKNLQDENLPGFDQLRDDLKSGYIDFDIANLTEISINQGLNSKEQGFYKNANGKYMIPGATLRGFIRSHCELLSFSYPKFIENKIYTYRDFAGIGPSRKEYIKKVLKKSKSKGYDLNGVKAGYIYKTKEDGSLKWYIQPVKAFGDYQKTFFKVSEKKIPRGYLKNNQKMYDSFGKINRNYQPYRSKTDIKFGFDRESNSVNFDEKKFTGRLLNSNYIHGKKHHYLVSAAKTSKKNRIQIDQLKILQYENEFEANFKKKNANYQDKDEKATEEYYALPSEVGEDNGKLFFYKEEKGKIIGFGATPYIRIFYDHSVIDGIPYDDQGGIDYADALFGFTNKEESFKSRLSFRDAIVENNPRTKKEKRVLSEPKGTSYQLYLEQQTLNVNNYDTYNSNDFQLRGYKFYWKRERIHKENIDYKNKNIFSDLDCIDKGNEFKARIYFNNLKDDELGLLLCAIQYKNANDQDKKETFMIGKGKPYGFGQIEIKNVSLNIFDTKNQFTSLQSTVHNANDKIESLKKYFKDHLLKIINDNLENGSYRNLELLPTYKTYIAYAYSGNMDYYVYGDGEIEDPTYMTIDDYKERDPLEDPLTIIEYMSDDYD